MNKIQFLILIILVSCSEKKNEPKTSLFELKKDWIELNNKDSIPNLLNLSLKKIFKNDLYLANPNERFNATDIITNDSIPTKQLRLLSKKNNLWRITYIQGGFVNYYVYAEYEIPTDSVVDFKISITNLKLENNDSIDKYIAEKRIEVKTVKIRMK